MNQIGNSPNLIGAGIETFAANSAQADGRGMESRIESIGKEFEGVFLSLMLKEMRNTLDGGGFFGEESSDTYGGMFDMFIGQDLAATSPLGIADMLLQNYNKNQGPASDQTATSDSAAIQASTDKYAAASSLSASKNQIAITA